MNSLEEHFEQWQAKFNLDKYQATMQALLSHQGKQLGIQVTFEPHAKQVPKVFNLWTGFAVQPVQNLEKVKPIVDHIYHVICNGKLDAFQYFIQWLAHAVQKTNEKPGVAICITGPQGSGKSILANLMTAIFGIHGMHNTNSTVMICEFNSLLAKTVFLHVDEAYCVGNKQHDSLLKGLITEPKSYFNELYGPIMQMPNYTRLMFTTNSKWIVSHEINNRFFCMTANDSMVGNSAYFAALLDAIENGGKEAFLHFLLSLDISTFNVNDVPETKESLNQRVASDSFLAWWIECIKSKSLVGISGNESATFCQANNRYYVARDSLTYAINQFYPNTIKRQCNLSYKFKTVLPCEQVFAKRDRKGDAILIDNPLIILHDKFPGQNRGCVSFCDDWNELTSGFRKCFNLELFNAPENDQLVDYWDKLKFTSSNDV